MRQTPTSLLADQLLGGLEEFVLSRRAAGMSWRRIAIAIYDATDRKLMPTHESIRSWFPDDANGNEVAA